MRARFLRRYRWLVCGTGRWSAHEHRLTGQVGVIGSGGSACGDERQPVAVVGADGRHHDLRPRGHRVQRRRLRGIRGDQRPGLRRLPQRFPDRQQLVLASGPPARCGRRRPPWPDIRRSAFRRTRSRRTGRCRTHARHGADATRASRAGSTSSPSTCWPRKAIDDLVPDLGVLRGEHPVVLGRGSTGSGVGSCRRRPRADPIR